MADYKNLKRGVILDPACPVQHGGRLLSAYLIRGVKVWVITEADRSLTTVLLPEDY